MSAPPEGSAVLGDSIFSRLDTLFAARTAPPPGITVAYITTMRLVSLLCLLPLVACIAEGGEDATLYDGSFVVDGPSAEGAYPIVFAHGFLSSAETGFSTELMDALAEDGFTLARINVPGIDSVENRAVKLVSQIESVIDQTGADKVHIVAHSMGGLDARYAISHLDGADGFPFANRVASLSTISTPHRGSLLADIALGFSTILDPAGLAKKVLTKLGKVGDASNLPSAFEALSKRQAPTFNENTPDKANVYYQSWAGLSTSLGVVNPHDRKECEDNPSAKMWSPERRDRLRGLFWSTAPWVRHGVLLRPHDGVVTVRSAKWGVFRGCIPADHLDETKPTLDERTNFDGIDFYRKMAFELAARR